MDPMLILKNVVIFNAPIQREGTTIQSTIVSIPSYELAPPPFPQASVCPPPLGS